MLGCGCKNDRKGLACNCLLLYVNCNGNNVKFPACSNYATGYFTSVGNQDTTDTWLAIVVKWKRCDEQVRNLVHIHVDCTICF
jgi:hypothetical protein